MGKFQTEIRLSREMTLLDATMIGVGVAGPALLIALGLLALLAGYAVMKERVGKGTDRPRTDREGPST